MGGHPWQRLLLVLIAFGILAYPVWKLTGGVSEHLMAAVAPSPNAPQHLTLQVTLASPPRAFTLTYLGQNVLETKGNSLAYAGNLDVAIPREGVDLLLKVQWAPGGARTAVQVKVMDQETVLVDKTFWAEDKLVEMVTIMGKSHPQE